MRTQVCAAVIPLRHQSERLVAALHLQAGRSTLFLAIVLSISCSEGDRPPAVATGSHGGALIISASGDPESLFPPIASTVPARIIMDLVYDRLAEVGDSMNITNDQAFEPRLARSWTWSADSLSIAFSIDPRARWHDGTPVDAGDVTFTWRLYSDSATGSPYRASIASIDSVTARDSLTAVVWFRERSPMQFYDAVNAMSILPEHAVGASRGIALRSAAIAREPVGSGRFRFVRWNPGAALEVAADTANYRGRPNLDRVIMTIAADGNAALTRLLSGEADLLEQIPAASMEQVTKDTALRLVLARGLDYNFIQFNLRHPRNRNSPHPIFADRAVRRALTAAIDRRSIVRNAYDSLADPALGPTVRAFPTTDTALQQIPFSPDVARRTLDSLGWRDTNGDGIREKNNRPLEFSLGVPGSSKARNTMAVLAQEQLRQVGVKVNLDLLDFTAFIDKETRGDFDAVFGGWRVEASPGGIRQTWGSTGGTNYGAYRNAAFDALVDSALSAADLSTRRSFFRKAYQIIIDDAPAIWFAEPKRVMAIHRRIETRGLRPDAWWTNIAEWAIPPDRRIARDRPVTAR